MGRPVRSEAESTTTSTTVPHDTRSLKTEARGKDTLDLGQADGTLRRSSRIPIKNRNSKERKKIHQNSHFENQISFDWDPSVLLEDLSKMERGLSDELQQIKAAITKFSELSLTSKDASSSISNRISQNLTNQEESRDGGRPLVSAKLAKLEFPKYSGDDPTEWFTRVDQFFEYQGTPDSEKVSLASYHLWGEANEWWQWLRRTHTEAGMAVTWAIFSEELWSRFGPTDYEDFDESLSKFAKLDSCEIINGSSKDWVTE
ncbi:hypothetical protein GH714_007360 [Hevea brasiliensis]|uniref:Retrotransposon gag domain-containing protein n=1 Tax=Hevea brasiliensis TaxID=3981 RepID=A0A6A6MBG2_HEVBR|nr:hypothetical protein GH714_007360 [Hevea brasiliensis]